MKTDKELLELAAKAAGIDCDSIGPFIEKKEWVQEFGLNGGFELVRRDWNPLKDNNDAFCLAVTLHLDVINSWEIEAVCRNGEGAEFYERKGIADFSATRRAIVRAAAAIGESK